MSITKGIIWSRVQELTGCHTSSCRASRSAHKLGKLKTLAMPMMKLLDMKIMMVQVFWGKENVDKKRNTNPILRGSLIFTCCANDSSEHFQEANPN